MEEKGVTPIPAPTKILTSNLNTSPEAVPKGPSRRIWGSETLTGSPSDLFFSPKVHPKRLARAVVQSPTTRMWNPTKFSSGALLMVNGCHSQFEISGQLTKAY
eukprot:Lithocolla_globosa_v1_NODE_3141_length_1752_cov_1619.678445.p2 type:complete len:103 gc:universal NODE_3141_length_1752_cov_1619.678445:525-833(+)